MTVHNIDDYERIAIYYLECRSCGHDWSTEDREEPCPNCGCSAEVYGIAEEIVSRLPATA